MGNKRPREFAASCHYMLLSRFLLVIDVIRSIAMNLTILKLRS